MRLIDLVFNLCVGVSYKMELIDFNTLERVEESIVKEKSCYTDYIDEFTTRYGEKEVMNVSVDNNILVIRIWD